METSLRSRTDGRIGMNRTAKNGAPYAATGLTDARAPWYLLDSMAFLRVTTASGPYTTARRYVGAARADARPSADRDTIKAGRLRQGPASRIKVTKERR